MNANKPFLLGLGRTLAGLLLFFLVLLFNSCGKFDSSCVIGEGSLVTETRTVPSFSFVDNATQLNIVISQGAQQEVEIQAQPNIQELIFMEVSDEVLYLGTDKCLAEVAPTVIYITVPEFRGINHLGTGTVEVRQFTGLESLNVISQNSGDVLFLSQIDSLEEVNIIMTSSGNLELTFTGLLFAADMQGSGSMTVGGAVRSQELFVQGSGDFKGFGLLSDSCRIQTARLASAEISVNDYLNVNIGGDGDVTYIGDPRIVSNIVGSGRLIDGN